MTKKKIQINTRATREIDRYPMVAVYWLDICSDSSWQSMEGCKKAKLPTCVTHGHLLTQTKGVRTNTNRGRINTKSANLV